MLSFAQTTTINNIIGVVVVVVGGVHMCISFSRAASNQPERHFLPVHKSVHKLCKSREICTGYAQDKIYAHFLHKINTSYAQGLYHFVTG